jgi:hypothetical protein
MGDKAEESDPLAQHAANRLYGGVTPMPGTTDATDESNGTEASNAAVLDGLADPGSALIADGASGDLANDSAGILLEKDENGKSVQRLAVGSDYAREKDVGGWFGSLYARFDRWLRRTVKSLSVEQTAVVAVVLIALYSFAISYQPLALLHWAKSNGVGLDRMRGRMVIRKMFDTAALVMNGPLRPVTVAFKFLLALPLVPALILLSIATSPAAVRSVLTAVMGPSAATLVFWMLVKILLPASLAKAAMVPQGDAMSMIMASTVVGGAMLLAFAFGQQFAPNLTKWFLGDLLPGGFVAVVITALAFGTFMAILHVEGNRKVDATVAPLDVDMVSVMSVCMGSFAAVVCALLLPGVNRRQFARMRLVSSR